MIPIYPCDDEEAVRHQLQTALEWKIFVENYDMKVVLAASTAGELLDAALSYMADSSPTSTSRLQLAISSSSSISSL